VKTELCFVSKQNRRVRGWKIFERRRENYCGSQKIKKNERRGNPPAFINFAARPLSTLGLLRIFAGETSERLIFTEVKPRCGLPRWTSTVVCCIMATDQTRGDISMRAIVRGLRKPARWEAPSGESIKSMRHRLGLSQSQFAETFGVDFKSLLQWEQGRRRPEQVTCLLLLMIQADSKAVKRLINKVRKGSDSAWLPPGSYTRETLPSPPPPAVRKILKEVGFYELEKRLEGGPDRSLDRIKLVSRQRRVGVKSLSPGARHKKGQ